MAQSRVHLIVLIHGLYGNPDNLAVVKEELERAARREDSDRITNLGDEGTVEGEEDVVELLLDSASPRDSNRSRSTSHDSNIEVKILVCKSFTGSHTWDGIDVNAHKAAEEIDAAIKEMEGEGKVVEVFSVVCHSSWSLGCKADRDRWDIH
jgi:hypothetical protein